MKKIFLSLAILFSLFNASAQVSYYKGEWTKVNSEDNFSAFLKLEIKDSVATGEIIWKFKAIDSADDAAIKYYKGKKEKMGIEYVKGIFSQNTNDIHLEGIYKTDPDLIIGMDKYILKLSLDKLVIYGRSLSNGENNGLVYFYSADSLTASKEFDLLKANILSKSADKALR